MFETVILFALAGLAAGFLAGLLGIGGGLVVVPLLYFHFSADPATAGQAMHLALGSSLAFIVLNSGIAAWTHIKLDGVRWPDVRRLAPGLAAGSLLGAAIADRLATDVLAKFFGGFLLVMAALMFLRRRASGGHAPAWLSAIIGLPMGTLAALAGVGGGVMVVPWLLARGHIAAHAIASSSVCTVLVAFIGTIGYVFFADEIALPGATGYVYWPAVLGIAAASFLTAPYGARLAHRVNQQKLRKGFALLLIVVGFRLLLA